MDYKKIKVNYIDQTIKLKKRKCNYSDKVCPDQYVADLQYNATTYKWGITNNNIDQRKKTLSYRSLDINYDSIDKNKNYILIILESPHFDEYDPNTHEPYGPACGDTGYRFNKYFAEIINDKDKGGDVFAELKNNVNYRIVFINAVQFQASNGISPLVKSVRNSNWIGLWNKYFNKDLIDRINAFPVQNTIVLDLCTKGKSGKNNLQDMVERELTENNIIHFKGYHPCTWNIVHMRTITKDK